MRVRTYKAIPSKKGNFPKGVLIGRFGSLIKEVCLSTTTNTSMPVKKAINRPVIVKSVVFG